MEIGSQIIHTNEQTAAAIQQAAAVFNAFGESTPSQHGHTAGEYAVEIGRSIIRMTNSDDVYSLRVHFLAGNHLSNPSDWNECVAGFNDCWQYISNRPAS